MNTALAIIEESELGRLAGDDTADGFGALQTASGILPLQAMDVKGKIAGLLAHVAVEQTFVNVFDRPLEATYIFPLPPQAAVTSFRMEVADRVVRGQLKERGEAREVYEEAIASGQRAAIAEEERPDVFTMQVGNLLPQERATLRLTMTFPLVCRDGEVTFRFPLVVAPRYIPGQGLAETPAGDGTARDTDAVPDASRISPPVLLKGYPNPIQLGLTLEIEAGDIPIDSLQASLHTLLLGHEARRLLVSLEPGERLDRDFLLRYAFGGAEVLPSLQLAPDRACRPHWEQREAGDIDPGATQDDQGTLHLTLTPPRLESVRKPRDIVFVLDRSGSMSGWKMVVARRAVAQMIDSLHPRDQFQVLAFDTVCESPDFYEGTERGGLIPARRKYRLAADEYLAEIDARGGTQMAGPLKQAALTLNKGEEGRERVLVLITDGEVGNEDQILATLRPHCEDLRVFTLGIGTAVNAGFLERFATFGGGACELVESEGRLEDAFARIQRLIENPVLSELEIEVEGIELQANTLCPGRLPDLFEGVPLTILGRYRGNHEGAVVLKAKDSLGNLWKHRIHGESSSNPSIPTVWARQHLRKLEDDVASGARPLDQVESDILETSLKFGVLCRFTAFVAVDEEKVVQPNTPTHHVVQAVEAPAGWTMEEEAAVEEEVEERRNESNSRKVKERQEAENKRSVSHFRQSVEVEKRADSAPDAAMSTGAFATFVPEPEPEEVVDFRAKGKREMARQMPVNRPVNMAREEKPKPRPRKAPAPISKPAPMKTPAPAAPVAPGAVMGGQVSSDSSRGGGGAAFGRGAEKQKKLPSKKSGGKVSSNEASSPMLGVREGRASSGRKRRGAKQNLGPLSVRSARRPAPVTTSATTITPTITPPLRDAKPRRHGASESETKTQSGMLMGNLRHLSPEEIRGEALTSSTEQFGLGTILYQLLTGKRLYSRENDMSILHAILQEPLPTPLLEEPGLQPIVAFLSQLLAKDPAARFDSIGALLAALVALQEDHFASPNVDMLAWLEGYYAADNKGLSEELEALDSRTDVSQEDYLLVALLESGGGCEDWLAARRDASGEVRGTLLRLLSPPLSEEPGWCQPLLTEGAMSHANIQGLQEVGVTTKGEHYQVWSYMPGINLRRVFSRLRHDKRPMPPALALALVHQLASGLQAFYQATDATGQPHNAVFGGLTPEHIMLGFDGVARITRVGPMSQGFQAPLVQTPLRRVDADNLPEEQLWDGSTSEDTPDEPSPQPDTLVKKLRSLFRRS